MRNFVKTRFFTVIAIAAMLLTMAPIVVLYFAFSKQIINGMVAGAVKG